MRVKIQQVLPQGFDKVEPHSWECELYKEDKNGQILVPIDAKNCREKGIKDTKIGDFVAVRLDESGKTGTIAGQIVEFVDEKGEKSLDTAQDEQIERDALNAFANSEGETIIQAKNDELITDKDLVLEEYFQALKRGDFARADALRLMYSTFSNDKNDKLKLKREISRLKDELLKAKQEVDAKVWQGQRNLSLAFNRAMNENFTLKKENASLKEKVALSDKKKASKKRRKIAKNALLDILWAKEQQHINFRHTKAFYADKQRLLRWAVLDFVGLRKLFKKLRIVDLIITRINKKKCFMWFNEDEFQRNTEAITTLFRLNLPFIIVSGVTTDEPEVAMCNGKKQSFISEKFIELANELKERLKGGER